MVAIRSVRRMQDLLDVSGIPGDGKSPVSQGGAGFPLTPITTTEDLDGILTTVAEVTWGAIPLQNGFANVEQGWAPARYRFALNNVVYLQGLIKRATLKDGDAGLVIGTLPPQARPGYSLLFSTPTDSKVNARIDVKADGSIVFQGYFTVGVSPQQIPAQQQVFLSLSNIVFSIEGAIPTMAELRAGRP